MPNWKKVLVSGSNAELGQVTASVGFKGDGSGLTNVPLTTTAENSTSNIHFLTFVDNASGGTQQLQTDDALKYMPSGDLIIASSSVALRPRIQFTNTSNAVNILGSYEGTNAYSTQRADSDFTAGNSDNPITMKTSAGSIQATLFEGAATKPKYSFTNDSDTFNILAAGTSTDASGQTDTASSFKASHSGKPITIQPSTGTVGADSFKGEKIELRDSTNNSTYYTTLTAGNIAASRNIQLPITNGTLALTTDTVAGATQVTVTDNESTSENNLIAFVANAASTTGLQSLEMDGDFTYNPSTSTVHATIFDGNLTGNAASATQIKVTDNENANEQNLITFVANAASTTGMQDLEMDGNLAYRPSTGTLTSTIFSGDLSGNATTATTADHVKVTDNESTNENNLITFVENGHDSTGNYGLEMDGQLYYNPSSGTLSSTAFSGNLSGTATNANHVLVTDNESTNENNLITFVENAQDGTGNHGLEMDGQLYYNPSSGTVTATGFAGNLSGNATTATQLANSRTIGGVSFNGGADINLPGVNTAGTQDTSGNAATATLATTATTATNVVITDNESTNEDNAIVFVANADVDGNTSIGLESDGDLKYNPSTGKLTSTKFAGDGSELTNLPAPAVVTYNDSGNNRILTSVDSTSIKGEDALLFDGTTLTVTGELDVDDIIINGSTIGHTNDTDLMTLSNGKLVIAGDLEIQGTTTTVSSTEVSIADKILTLNAGSAAGDGGIYVNDADTTETGSLLWDVSTDRWIGGLKDNEVTIPTISSTDTLTNKTLTTPVISTITTNGNTLTLPTDGAGTLARTSDNVASATILATARNIGGVSFNGSADITLPGVNSGGNQDTSGTAAIATTVTISDNENTSETNAIVFTSGGTHTGNLGLESDGDLTYNPSTGRLTATQLAGDGSNITNLPIDTIANFGDNNRLITAAGANAVNAESKLTFDGSELLVDGSVSGSTVRAARALYVAGYANGSGTVLDIASIGTSNWFIGKEPNFTPVTATQQNLIIGQGPVSLTSSDNVVVVMRNGASGGNPRTMSGGYNTIMGSRTAQAAVGKLSHSTILGASAAHQIVSSSYNTIIGQGAAFLFDGGISNQSGGGGFPYYDGTFQSVPGGESSTYFQDRSKHNVFIGHNAATFFDATRTHTTLEPSTNVPNAFRSGSYNTFVGDFTKPGAGFTQFETVLGTGVIGHGSYTSTIGSGSLYVSSQGDGDVYAGIFTGSAVTVSGNISVGGTVDGRDLQTDGTKLDGIETSADVTDTVNVTSAGAVMDSEVTNLSFVKGLTSGISNGNVLVVNANVVDDDFLKIDGTSVEGRTAAEVRSDLNVEDGADVTDTTNVEAAGALMDSEVTDLSGIKGVTISNLATKTGTETLTNKTLTTPDIGTPSAGVLTNTTGYPGDSNLVTVGTIGTGTWNGTAISSQYLDSDTAHLTTDQTFTGKKTFSNAITGSHFSGSSISTGSFGHVHIIDGDSGLGIGDDNDLLLYHDGSNSYIKDNGTGNLNYMGGTQTFQNAAGSKTMMVLNAANSVDLHFNDSKKLETTNDGVSVTGDMSVSGKLTAQEFHTTVTSASIIFSDGSNQFGNSMDDIHTFSGSLVVTGSISGSQETSASFGNIFALDNIEAMGTGSFRTLNVVNQIESQGRVTAPGLTSTANNIFVDTTVTGILNVVGNITGSNFSGSSVSTGSFGTIKVDDTTKVDNLNADLLDGQTGTYYTDFSNMVVSDDEIPIAKLVSDNVSYGGVTLALGGTDATPAFNLSDATAYVGDSSLVTTGTITTGVWNSSFGAVSNTLISGSWKGNNSIDISADTNLAVSTGITLTGDTLTTNDSAIVHDDLSGFVADEHINHTAVDITAGAGLTGGGDISTTRTLNVVGGTGITANADNITTNDSEIVHDDLSGFVANEHIDHSGVSITAGTGLTGGGTIESTRTLNVVGGTGITANADDIAIDFGDSTLQTTISGSFTEVSGGFSTRITNTELSASHSSSVATRLTDLEDNTSDVTLGGSLDYLTINNQVITRNAIDLSTDVTGTLPLSGTGLVAGTNITLSTNTLNVDDAFIKNDADDSTSGKITAGGFITSGHVTASLGVSGSLSSTGSFGRIEPAGNLVPKIHNTSDLGSPNKRWANIYSQDLQLSNENADGNEVDGTTGSWTIQEGSDDLYLLNRKNGKKYRFKLEEIT